MRRRARAHDRRHDRWGPYHRAPALLGARSARFRRWVPAAVLRAESSSSVGHVISSGEPSYARGSTRFRVYATRYNGLAAALTEDPSAPPMPLLAGPTKARARFRRHTNVRIAETRR